MNRTAITVASGVTSGSSNTLDAPYIRTIEWDMMDKTKFFPLSMLSSFSVRCCLFPLTVIKTQLQVQHRSDVYKGMFDCAYKIYRSEGIPGLYRGFWISSVQIVSGVFYISTYEGVRHLLNDMGAGHRVKALIGGGCASLVGQTIIVPFDVISQHAMVLGMAHHAGAKGDINPLGIQTGPGRSRLNISLDIAREILRRDGFRGFYRGYTASLMAYVPNSAMWWAFYHLYQDELCRICPPWVSHLLIQCVAGSLGGFTTTILTNPLDIVRARLQVHRLDSMKIAFQELWREEKLNCFFKGLSARLVQSAAFSFSIILGYETIKRIAVDEQYKHQIRW
ncbi:solute carrier family 25 member 44 [Lucilia sericata]|uniref:solute carrier family 25 member 44 n=1 Tax=Lucilia sericata TaxID=13632 RepID=UPI0018A812C9|nr:solute carrier family 25 member 44 [Lucilia sericata]XP_037828041.1 solute carrier family 25 member 44 [Lucilia sericata]XP_037828042.1 solute carrier family 25 member 44 [Lucilia sericata]XP_037828043.1 solute carrier family 25 member 44 [Lucilia sericata]XP_037828044.1 solute carrier family 25 member 44 [Lucilia sericata]XP_037828045.1 solute carrier family 25 member 44 [Lucilia sericata]